MKIESELEYVAVSVKVVDQQICLDLADGTTFSFPAHFFERLANASSDELNSVKLRVGGRALRWETLDEDIWLGDVILRRYPKS